jgi:hypothetical protein
METKTDYYKTDKSFIATKVSSSAAHQNWIRCPRCVGGKMYRENKDEYVCLQCGCTTYSAEVAKTPFYRKVTFSLVKSPTCSLTIYTGQIAYPWNPGKVLRR